MTKAPPGAKERPNDEVIDYVPWERCVREPKYNKKLSFLVFHWAPVDAIASNASITLLIP